MLFCFSMHANQSLASDPKYLWMDEAIENQFSGYEESGISKAMIEMTKKTRPQNCQWKNIKLLIQSYLGQAAQLEKC